MLVLRRAEAEDVRDSQVWVALDGRNLARVPDLILTTHIAMPDNVAIYAHPGWSETGRKGNKVFMAHRLDATEQE